MPNRTDYFMNNKYAYWGIMILIVVVVVFASAYSLKRVSYDTLHVLSREFSEVTYDINTDTMTNVRIHGSFEVTNGTTKDIEVYVFDRDNFLNWKNGYDFAPLFDSKRVTASRIDLSVTRSDTYYVVFNNNFSESPKDVHFEVYLAYTPAVFALPLGSLTWIFGIIIAAAVSYYRYIQGEKEGAVEKGLTAFSIALIAIVGVMFSRSPESTNFISTLLMTVNVILILWNIRLAQRNTKTQLLHEDRKKSLQKLFSILGDSKGTNDFIKKIRLFMATLDFELLPDSVKKQIADKILELEAVESNAPWNPQHTQQEINGEIKYYEELEREHWESMSAEERFTEELKSKEHEVKQSIRKEIKRYFEEPMRSQ